MANDQNPTANFHEVGDNLFYKGLSFSMDQNSTSFNLLKDAILELNDKVDHYQECIDAEIAKVRMMLEMPADNNSVVMS